jgi:imidazolonepropionase-like amidohydrolase
MRFILLVTLSFAFFFSEAQLITKKESAAISAIMRDLSQKHKPANYVFRNATLITMLDSALVPDQDVLVVDGLIRAIGKDLSDAGDAIEIDASKQYLMPGLADMHVHLFDGHPMKETWTLLLLINGVTTVRDMNGQATKISEREKIKTNGILSPYLYQAGPIITGAKESFMEFAATPEQGRAIVRKQKADGYDFIKVHDKLNKETYQAIVDEASRSGLHVAGHVPDQLNLSEVFAARQRTIEHLTGYFEWKNNIEVIITAESGYAQSSLRAGVWNCPTLFNHLMNISRAELTKELNDANTSAFVPRSLMERWRKPLENVNKEFDALSDANFAKLRDVVMELHRSGAPLIAGTDAGNLFFLVPGISLHKELILLNRIGIPPYEVLKTATVNASAAMDKAKDFGVIAIGTRADLILLDKNPIKDIATLQNKRGVMVRGIYFSKANLEDITSQVRLAFGN